MRYFITGTAGFIGFHLAKSLLKDGHTVAGFDGMTRYYNLRLKEKRLHILQGMEGFHFTNAMLEDQEALQNAIEFARPDVIIHLAAQAGVRYSLENPKAYVVSNLIGSWHVLESAKRINIPHLMLASTSSIYGANTSIPFKETDRADEPLTLYAASKKSMEAMAHSYSHLYGIPTTAFRFFTVYGPWGRPDMAPLKFTKAISAGTPIEIYGHGKMSRDFTYIGDLIESIRSLSGVVPCERNRVADIDTLSHQAPFRVVNIGGGQPVGLLDFIETVERCVGKPSQRKLLPMQQGDVPRTFCSPDLLEALTGSKPQTDIYTGMEELVKWFNTYKNELDL